MKKLNWIFALLLAADFTASPFTAVQAGVSDSLHYRFRSDSAVWNEELAAYTVGLDFEMKWDVPDEPVKFISALLLFDEDLFRFHSAIVDTANWKFKFKVIRVDSSITPRRVHIEWDTPGIDSNFSLATGDFISYGTVTFVVVNQSDPFDGGIVIERDFGNHAQLLSVWFLVDSNYTDGTPVFLGVTETPCCNSPGDANNNGQINISDVTFVISRIFGSGPPAPCLAEADADANATLNIADVTFMIARIFAGGPAPSCVSTIP